MADSDFRDKLALVNDYNNEDNISVNTLMFEEELKEEWKANILYLETLSKKVRHLHTNLLYYRHISSKKGTACYEAWRTLVKQVGRTPDTWRDLGHYLGITEEDLDYIKHTVKEDPVDTVLKVFLQTDNPTLNKVLDALVLMKKYDILSKIENPLNNLCQCFTNDDSGYQSSYGEGKIKVISFEKYVSDLPPVLNKNHVMKGKQPNRPMRSVVKPNMTKTLNDCPILFLTYAQDGYEAALNIQNCVENWDDMGDVQVITLNDRREEVYQNPEKYIREYFEKADYIVPIITSGYLNAIRTHTTSVPSTTENMDFKYVMFIYNLIANYYIHGTGCLNKKVRSVVPLNVDMNVLMDITMYPDLMPWTNEEQFDLQFKIFLKSLYNNDNDEWIF